jgi:hypothetical protein
MELILDGTPCLFVFVLSVHIKHNNALSEEDFGIAEDTVLSTIVSGFIIVYLS